MIEGVGEWTESYDFHSNLKILIFFCASKFFFTRFNFRERANCLQIIGINFRAHKGLLYISCALPLTAHNIGIKFRVFLGICAKLGEN